MKTEQEYLEQMPLLKFGQEVYAIPFGKIATVYAYDRDGYWYLTIMGDTNRVHIDKIKLTEDGKN